MSDKTEKQEGREEFTVTPWEVQGEVDYDRLIKQFGLQKLDETLLKRIQKKSRELHPLLERKFFFAHRDFTWVLDEYDKGNPFYLYTGRGPSGHTHLGHVVPWLLTKNLQDTFNVKLWFQMTDDEKFLFRKDLTLEETNKFAYENALDVIALGFDQKKTVIFSNLEYSKTLYKEALRVAKRLTFSTAKATFGFTNDTNVGSIFYTAMQSVPAFIESVKKGKNVPCLIPHAVDQDPHFRVARDILPKLGYPKPASIQCKFLPGLGEGGKMSASNPQTTIFTTDTESDVAKKIKRAYTGGRETIEEQKEKGGRPFICPIYHYWSAFSSDNKKVQEVKERCLSGDLMCGQDKADITEHLNTFLKKHQARREKAKSKVEDFFIRD
jgi:tryptophanyl-tRNA synthetase